MSRFSINKEIDGHPICKDGFPIQGPKVKNNMILDELQIMENKLVLVKDELSYLYGQDLIPGMYKNSIKEKIDLI